MKLKKLVCIALIVSALIPCAFASAPYDTYTYNYWREKKDSPPAYLPSRLFRPGETAAGSLRNPSDLFIAENGDIAVSDTGNNRVLIFDREFKLRKTLDTFAYKNEMLTLKDPDGIYIGRDGTLFVCDTGNGRIVRFTPSFEADAVFTRPDSPLLDSFTTFSPTKIAVNAAGKMYVICHGVNMGVLELDAQGKLDKFIGAPLVTSNILSSFWRMFSSKEQKKRMNSLIPTEYNNLFLDKDEFLYVTTDSVTEDEVMAKISARDPSTSGAPLKRLTLSGEDILIRGGYYPPVGDLLFPTKSQDYQTDGEDNRSYLKDSEKGPSAFADVCAAPDGTYAALDAKRGRIFTYDDEGSLMFVFGGIGGQAGTFISPVSIAASDGKYYVLDKVEGTVTEFSRTEYGGLMYNAISAYENGDNDASLEAWKQVSARNANSEAALLGIGKIYLSKNELTKAMDYFKLANRRDYYSKAQKLYNNNVLSRYFGTAVFGALALAVLIILIVKIRKAILTVIRFNVGDPEGKSP